MVEIGTGLLALGFFLLIGFIYYVDYLKNKDRPANVDPLSKGLILSFLIIGTLFLAEAVGFFEKGWNQEHWYFHLITVILLVSVLLLIATRKKPLPYLKQKAIVKNVIIEEFFGEDYVGVANINWLQLYKVTKEGNEPEAVAATFFVEAKAEDTIKVYVKINVFTGQFLHIQKSPSQILENELLRKQSPYKDRFAESFDDTENNNAEQST